MAPLIVYFSSKSGNTKRFVESLGVRSIVIPISAQEDCPIIQEPYVLICPTYADNDGSNAVPKPVIRFLNNPQNRGLMQGVIGAGNRNFGDFFAHSGRVIANKCNVPLLYKLELSGTIDDIERVKKGILKLWETLKPSQTQLKTGS